MRGRWEMLGNMRASHRCPEPVAVEADLELEEPQRWPGAEMQHRGWNLPCRGEICSGARLSGAPSETGMVTVPHSGPSGEGRLRTRARVGAQMRLVVRRGLHSSKG